MTLGPKQKYDAGPYALEANELFIHGKPSGFVSADFGLTQFSSRYSVYLDCRVNPSSRRPDGCFDWVIRDLTTSESQPLALPGHVSFFAAPAFSWPYIAYVAVPKSENPNYVHCIVVKWPDKAVVVRKKVKVAEGFTGTDAPGLFPPPAFVEKAGKLSVSFLMDDSGTKTIASVLVP